MAKSKRSQTSEARREHGNETDSQGDDVINHVTIEESSMDALLDGSRNRSETVREGLIIWYFGQEKVTSIWWKFLGFGFLPSLLVARYYLDWNETSSQAAVAVFLHIVVWVGDEDECVS